MTSVFCKNIEKLTLKNKSYRNVLYTNPKGMQFVLMSLKVNEEIGMEKHNNIDQFIKVESGMGQLHIMKDDIIKKYKLEDGFGMIIPSKTFHNIINTGVKELKLYTVYSAPDHEDGLIQRNKNIE